MTAPVAVVTGAAGRIGRAICDTLDGDYTIVGIDRIDTEMPFPIILADITNREDISNAAQIIENEFGSVRCLVNSAGVLTMDRFLDLSDEDWHEVFSVNVYGTHLVSQVFSRAMIECGRDGLIVNVASIAGKTPLPNQAHYCASKAAVMMLTRVMALELAENGIRVFSICPGAVDSALFRHCLAWSAEREGRDPESLLEEWLRPSRIGRFVEPREIGALVHFLVTGPTDALTGHSIPIDGGVSPW